MNIHPISPANLRRFRILQRGPFVERTCQGGFPCRHCYIPFPSHHRDPHSVRVLRGVYVRSRWVKWHTHRVQSQSIHSDLETDRETSAGLREEDKLTVGTTLNA